MTDSFLRLCRCTLLLSFSSSSSLSTKLASMNLPFLGRYVFAAPTLSTVCDYICLLWSSNVTVASECRPPPPSLSPVFLDRAFFVAAPSSPFTVLFLCNLPSTASPSAFTSPFVYSGGDPMLSSRSNDSLIPSSSSSRAAAACLLAASLSAMSLSPSLILLNT